EVVGIVSQRDLAVLAGLDLDKQVQVRASDLMKPDPVTVRSSDPLDDVAYRMSERKIGSVIVLDDSGAPYGIFTATDALNALIEIVRDPDGLEAAQACRFARPPFDHEREARARRRRRRIGRPCRAGDASFIAPPLAFRMRRLREDPCLSTRT